MNGRTQGPPSLSKKRLFGHPLVAALYRIFIVFPAYLSLRVHGHVHPDELLVGHPLRALLAEAQWGVNVAEHLVHLSVADLTTEEKNVNIYLQ